MTTSKPHPREAYFEAVGDLLGKSYLRYEFTKGTAQEVAFLLELLALPEGSRILDVGCGPGRHAVPLAQAGLAVTGVDVSRRFLDIAAEAAGAAGVGASFFHVDARAMPFGDEFDAVLSICEGAFGLMAGDDSTVLKRMAEAVKPGGRVVVTAFSSLYEASHPREGATCDADAGVVHELTTVKDEAGADHEVDLWTSVYTARELRLLALGVGLIPEAVWAVEPGAFAKDAPDLEHAELMLVARRP